jgi:hypothetical protein
MNAESTRYDCLLNIAFAAMLEEDFIEVLEDQSAIVSGFTILPAEGFGAGARQHSALEQVRGRARRRLLQILMTHEQVEPLLAALRERAPSQDVAWWTTPVSAFGRFA